MIIWHCILFYFFLLVYLIGGPTRVLRENVLSGLALSVFAFFFFFLAIIIFLSPRVYRELIEDA